MIECLVNLYTHPLVSYVEYATLGHLNRCTICFTDGFRIIVIRNTDTNTYSIWDSDSPAEEDDTCIEPGNMLVEILSRFNRHNSSR